MHWHRDSRAALSSPKTAEHGGALDHFAPGPAAADLSIASHHSHFVSSTIPHPTVVQHSVTTSQHSGTSATTKSASSDDHHFYWNTRRLCNLVLAAFMICGLLVGLSMWYGGGCGTSGLRQEIVVVPPEWARFASSEHEDAPLWDYSASDIGPANWGSIRNATTGRLLYPECAGFAQSPIDIEDAAAVPALGQAEVDQVYTVDRYTIVPRHGHHSFQLVPDESDGGQATWFVDGRPYYLRQLHAHSPSEHRLNGKRFPLELHIIHEGDDGQLAGLAILYDTAEDEAPNPYLRAVWDQIYFETETPLVGSFNFTGLVHDFVTSPHRLYRYPGSLTVPPCTQDLTWHLGISKTGINTAQHIMFKYSMRVSFAGEWRG